MTLLLASQGLLPALVLPAFSYFSRSRSAERGLGILPRPAELPHHHREPPLHSGGSPPPSSSDLGIPSCPLQGHEMGMIEDMDSAVLWLSTVTIRFINTIPEITVESKSEGDAVAPAERREKMKKR
jgi:hypothetical protein